MVGKRASFTVVLLMAALLVKAQPEVNEVLILSQTKSRINYLEKIYDLDQEVRHYEDSVMYASGFHSPPHLAAIDSLRKVDSLLSHKIDRYLKTYGYPERKEYGEKATLAPLLILNHTADQQLRMDHIKDVYKAYRDEQLEQRRLIEYLEKAYQYQFQKDFQSYSQDEMRVRELLQALKVKR